MKRIAVLVVPCLLALAGGCGVTSYVSNERVVVAPQNPNCLRQIKQARDYMARGRYELAKEHYLMALVACDDGESRDVATRELQAADMMIQTQR
ncbi:MAG: hypothetical protein LBD42_08450 [Desulfovibrio sp.]|nr:hypothetical protein [Desulfovibrio sp.]